MRFPASLIGNRGSRHVLAMLLTVAVAVAIRLPGFFPASDHADAITFRAHDGHRHVFLAGYDSYHWLTLSRTMLATGSPCDRFDGVACIDAHANAPVGQPIADRYSPHVAAIAGMHRLLDRIDRGIPLSTSAMILTVLIAALGAVAAYVIGTLAAGAAGGIVASVLVSCNPVVLGRTLEGDDDIWVVVLPLVVCCAVSLALRGRARAAYVFWPVVAGGTLGLIACTWEGWPFFCAVTAAGLFVAGVLRRDRRAAVVACIATLVFIVCAAALGVRPDPSVIATELLRFAGLAPAPAHVVTAPFPNTFADVQELRDADISMLVTAFGLPAFVLGLAGVALALTFFIRSVRTRTAAAATVVLATGALSIAMSLAHVRRVSALIAALITGAAIYTLRRGESLRTVEPVWYVLAAWLTLALLVAFNGLRYVMLAAVPLSLIAGATAGALIRSAASIPARLPVRKAVRAGFCVAIVALVLGPGIVQGAKLAVVQRPEINRAWIDTLFQIRDGEPPSSIVDTWWNAGHWAKYYSRRAVSNDGSTLRNTTNYWLALALVSPSEADSVRYLRMLNCGDVADPETGARARPFETLVRWLGDEAAAYRLITSLMTSSPEHHREILARAGLDSRRSSAIVRTVDCTPPPSVLVVSTRLLGDASWYLNAFWDPYRAYLVDAARTNSASAAGDAARRYGRTLDESRTLLPQAAAATTDALRDTFAAPHHAFTTHWMSCLMDRALLQCPISAATVYLDPATRDRVALVNGSARVPLSSVIFADGARPATIVPSGSDPAGPAVIADVRHLRVFVVTPDVARSLLVRLSLLAGAGSKLFTPIVSHRSENGEEVSSWRVRWDRSAGVRGGVAQ